MKLRRYFCAAAVCCAVAAWAAPLPPQQALKRVLSNKPRLAPALNASNPLTLQLSIGSPDLPLYLFANASGQFVVAAGDDRAPAPLLGYGNGFVPGAELPDNLKWALGIMARNQVYAPVAPSADRAVIAPLLKTTWDQSSPFNDLAPALTGGKQAAAGCVATAMAQIARFWEWPKQTSGEISYTYKDAAGSARQYTVDITRSYDYSLMPAAADDYVSEAQCQAVAELVNTCGAAAKMMWGLPSTGGSGAFATEGLNGFIKYLGYSPAARMEMADWYTPDQWAGIVYGELEAGRPVFYGGAGTGGGHQFVCDGYAGDGYFHFNWGWSGLADGNFLLGALNPPVQGIGGNQGGFNEGQSIAVGLMPAHLASDNTPAPPVMCVYSPQFTVERTSYDRAATYALKFGGEFCNLSPTTITALPGLELWNPVSGKSLYLPASSRFTITASAGIREMAILESDFPDSGEYDVYPAFAIDGVWRRMRYPVATTGPLHLLCSPESLSFDTLAGTPAAVPFEAAWELTSVTDFSGADMPAESSLFPGRSYRLSFDILASRAANVKSQAIVYLNDREDFRVAGPILSLPELDLTSGRVDISLPDNLPVGASLAFGLRIYNSDDIDLILEPDRKFAVVADPDVPVVPEYLDELTAINGQAPGAEVTLTCGEPFSLCYDFMTDTDLGNASVSFGLYYGQQLVQPLWTQSLDVAANELYSIQADRCVIAPTDALGVMKLGVSITSEIDSYSRLFDTILNLVDKPQENSLTAVTGSPAGAPEWFTIQGVRIARPSVPGIYILRRDGKSEKCFVK